ncbi:hypothetical protein PV327_008431 [Microctonus hyperodae]|uniref:procollagen-proline 3-dioxygenase n=1 Tax=Microctonus hyperodae TaxID=165561 RepID=A0AA39F339_MICHY|nr:hypothetical protein PV327_008431 [Microctonus hyperodae]
MLSENMYCIQYANSHSRVETGDWLCVIMYRFKFISFLFFIIAVLSIANASSELLDNELSIDDDDDVKKNNDDKVIDGFDEDDDDDEQGAIATPAVWKKSTDENYDDPISDFESLNLDDAYEHAVQSYLDDNFDDCIDGFNNIIKRYKKYRNAVINCRTKCRKDLLNFTPILMSDIEDLHFYEKKIRETLCLLECNQDYRDVAGSQALRRLQRETEQKLMDLKHYEYLHICYYQRSRFQDAANAIFTYLTRHPKSEMSIKNLRYYLSLPEVKDSDIINLESAPFVNYYINGVKAYEDEFYDDAVEQFETSLREYMKAEDECRIYCEGSFDQGWLLEFTSSVANHFAYCLKCKRSCSQFLNNLNGDYQHDLLASHYNYLQFAYYKLGDIKRTCQAVESYLLFFPADETMLNNKDYYSNLPKVKANYFTPREEAVFYVKRQEYELRILKFISEDFSAIDARLDAMKKKLIQQDINNNEEDDNLGKCHPPPGHSPSSLLMINNNTEAKEEILRRESQIKEIPSFENIKIIFTEKELGGKFRYTAEGLMTELECESLIQLATLGAMEGDGYDNNKSPHSKYELFEGLTLGRTALMVYFGLVAPRQLELFLQSSELARAHVEMYFNIDQHLYFTYTHLVCRTALPDSPVDQELFSHDVHADNCLAIKKGICLHESPAFTWRDYSAIIYLNNNFEGGEFIFADDPKAKIIQSTLRPHCGRMVAFSADGGNLHGVKGVRKGRRCALALWFTLDKKYVEFEQRLARVILDRVKLKGPVQVEKNFHIPRNYEKMLIQQFKKDHTLKLLLAIT